MCFFLLLFCFCFLTETTIFPNLFRTPSEIPFGEVCSTSENLHWKWVISEKTSILLKSTMCSLLKFVNTSLQWQTILFGRCLAHYHSAAEAQIQLASPKRIMQQQAGYYCLQLKCWTSFFITFWASTDPSFQGKENRSMAYWKFHSEML